MEGFGIRFVGINAENGQKLLLTGLLMLIVWGLGQVLRRLVRVAWREDIDPNAGFWVRQGINIGTTVVLLIGLLSIWFDDPTRLATALGLVTAGLAFALQKVVTAIAGYFVILRGNTFSVGERITMGGVRGDVIGLGFIQTTIMEMGQPPAVQGADPAMWVRSRQYTGRIVTVTNDKIFDEPVYNYTREFPYIWEEISLTIPYSANRDRAEEILLAAAHHHALPDQQHVQRSMDNMMRKYFIQQVPITPHTYYRLTESGLELTIRFLSEDRGVREIKDAMSREILQEFQAAGIVLASATLEIVNVPPINVMSTRQRPS